jgi:hypothetical protein
MSLLCYSAPLTSCYICGLRERLLLRRKCYARFAFSALCNNMSIAPSFLS